jgi:hypothetical protein
VVSLEFLDSLPFLGFILGKDDFDEKVWAASVQRRLLL